MTNDKGAVAPYEVGYGKPPVHTRFQPGQSGNPSGVARGPKPVSVKDAFLSAAVARVDCEGMEPSEEMSLIEALMIQLFRRSLAGDPRCAKLILELGREHLPAGSSAPAPQAVSLVSFRSRYNDETWTFVPSALPDLDP